MPTLTAETMAALTATDKSQHTDIDAAFRDTRARLHAFISRRVNSPQAAEDLTQEVLVRLLRSPNSDLTDPIAWLYRVARNVIIDHYRAGRPSTPLETDRNGIADTVIEPFTDDRETARRELAHCLHSMVDQLAEPYRSTVAAATTAPRDC